MSSSFLHPHGVLPEGNIFFSDGQLIHQSQLRASGLGGLSVLTDTLLVDLLTFCDEKSLA